MVSKSSLKAFYLFTYRKQDSLDVFGLNYWKVDHKHFKVGKVKTLFL